jgi:predicted Ser/Thr protein kinase
MIGMAFGPYRVESRLGGGGMGEVYAARDPEHGNRRVALKVLPDNLSGDPEYRERFRREAEHAAGLSDPHIATIHRYGEIDGRLFLDMELVDGRDLAAVVAEGPLPPATAVEIIEQVAGALDTAHAGGLVHRDIKASNVLVRSGDDGRPQHAVLIDFGIATATEPGSRTALTRTGAVIGTLAYMAPERFLGEPAGPAADVYSLACLLHELLTGRKPFDVHGLEAHVVAHLQQPPPRPTALQPALPADLDTVVAVGMAKDPAARYPTAGALAAAARAALGSAPRSGDAPSPPTVGASPVAAGPAGTFVATLQETLPPVPGAARRRGGPAWLLPAGAGVAVGGLALVVVLLTWTAGGAAPPPAGPPVALPTTAPAAAPVEPSADPIVDRAFVGAAPMTVTPNVGFLGGTPVLLTSGSPAQVLDMATGTQLGAATGANGTSGPSVIEHGGRSLLLGATYDNVLRVWDLATGQPLPTTFAGHTEAIKASAAGEVDGRGIVATSSFDNTTRLWDLDTGAPIGGPLPGPPDTTFGAGSLSALRFVPVGGRTLLVGAGDQMIHVWDAATGTEAYPPIPDDFQWFNGLPIATVGGRVVAVAENGSFLGPDLRRWTVHDLATGAEIGNVTITSSDPASVAGVAEVGGRGVLLVVDDRDVVMYDLASGAPVGSPLTGHEATVYGMTVVQSGDRTVLVTGSEDHSLRVWDLTGRGGR